MPYKIMVIIERLCYNVICESVIKIVLYACRNDILSKRYTGEL